MQHTYTQTYIHKTCGTKWMQVKCLNTGTLMIYVINLMKTLKQTNKQTKSS